jgi:hypothetical protein
MIPLLFVISNGWGVPDEGADTPIKVIIPGFLIVAVTFPDQTRRQ